MNEVRDIFLKSKIEYGDAVILYYTEEFQQIDIRISTEELSSDTPKTYYELEKEPFPLPTPHPSRRHTFRIPSPFRIPGDRRMDHYILNRGPSFVPL